LRNTKESDHWLKLTISVESDTNSNNAVIGNINETNGEDSVDRRNGLFRKSADRS